MPAVRLTAFGSDLAMIGCMSDLLARHGPKLAVGGLVALNLVLLGALALRDPVRTAVPAEPVPASSLSVTPRATTSSPSGTPEPTPSAGSSITPEPTPSDTPSAKPTRSPSKDRPNGKAAERPRLLAANSGRVAWRAKSTGCRGSAVVEVTTNGGRTWSKTKPGLTAIVRLKAYWDTAVFAVGADSRCRPTYAWITGPEQKWQRDRSRVKNIWYRSPDDLDEVHAPGGRRSRPCGDALVDLAGLGTFQAAVRCADGRIRTDAEDRSWETVQERSKVLSLNADDDQFVAVATRGDCKGAVVRRFDSSGNGLGTKGSCQSKIKTRSGTTVVSARYQQVWLWSGEQVLTN